MMGSISLVSFHTPQYSSVTGLGTGLTAPRPAKKSSAPAPMASSHNFFLTRMSFFCFRFVFMVGDLRAAWRLFIFGLFLSYTLLDRRPDPGVSAQSQCWL